MFDLQAHRGGAGLFPENTLTAFAGALTLGVSTLECDVHLTSDGVPVVRHDRTLPAPFDDKVIAELTLAELAGVDLGGGERIPTFEAVLDLLTERRADGVGVNVETKFSPLAPGEEAPRELFVDTLVEHVERARRDDVVTVQSFDWECLRLVRQADSLVRLNVLYDAAHLEAGKPGASPWLAGLDIDDFHGDVVEAAARVDANALSPSIKAVSPGLVAKAHAAGMRVVPWTVDDPADMRRVIEIGVDGLITNRPDVGREVLAELGMDLPPRVPG